MKSFHIHIKGRVQGIGFRPFIYNLAIENGIKGSVSNTQDGVHILITSKPEGCRHFISQIKKKAPDQALITSTHCEETSFCDFNDFSIIESNESGSPDMLITQDFAICENCRIELNDAKNRRYLYPFITCTTCGPRFSILTNLPYDRQRTSMKPFIMCPKCNAEYSEPTNRRFYSQTNSCPSCRVSQWIFDNKGNTVSIEESKIISFISSKLSEGAIFAIKGIGGYLLMCDANNSTKVNELRKKKQRPAKPFALLYPSTETVKEAYKISKEELNELQSPASPIVLLKPKKNKSAAALMPIIAPGLDRLGVMLPYAPVLLLIAQTLKRPLLATSGNIKGCPILFKNNEAVSVLPEFSDFILLNNREIQIPQDDSVVRFSPINQQKIMIRRSRGYAPAFHQNAVGASLKENVLAMGALIKSTFCIWKKNRCHISQYLGDTTAFDAQISYEQTLKHIQNLLKFKPEVVLVDKHPAYFATQYGKEIATDNGINVVEIQHHKAHFWAVLGENNLLASKKKILGVVFDGSGMGNDGAVWGGEFFNYDSGKISRLNHLKYFTHILGDKMAREPRLSALSLLHDYKVDFKFGSDVFSKNELRIYKKVLENASLQTSSMGRVFDAISSLLGLCQKNTYEGEGAMYLECEAQKYCKKNKAYPKPYFTNTDKSPIDLSIVILAILKDISKGKKISHIAAKFHRTIVKIVEDTASLFDMKSIAFSGGVFQNGLLIDMIINLLGKKYNLYFHSDLSPNDECISYGQLVGYYQKHMHQAQHKETKNLKNNK